MTYYIEVLAESTDFVPVTALRDRLREDSSNALIEDGEEIEDDWDVILLHFADEVPIANIHRYETKPDSTGKSINEEFEEQLEKGQPGTAARWLKDYLPKIAVVYSFQILSGTRQPGGWEAVWAVQAELLDRLGGIIHAENEGFYREGCLILWQLDDKSAEGVMEMAVLDEAGNWVRFEMDLSNPGHREAFKQGRVPDGVRLL